MNLVGAGPGKQLDKSTAHLPLRSGKSDTRNLHRLHEVRGSGVKLTTPPREAEQPGNPLVMAAVARRDANKETAQDLTSVRQHLNRVIASGSASASDYELYGYLLALSGDRDAAINTLKQGIALNPYSTRLYKRLALTYAHFHDYEQALAAMKQELRMFPEDSYMRGIVHRVESGAVR
ncbi:MAG TPA: hypothetical protein VGY31_15545 [Terriglobia bacterium]|nr:hypothetical protein [Terriglobia bacterium]